MTDFTTMPVTPAPFSSQPAAISMDHPAPVSQPAPQVTPSQPAPSEPATTAPAPSPEQMFAELEYLKAHGEDVSELRSELETMLRRPANVPQPPVQTQQAPQQQQPAQQSQAPKTAQEQALDPYAPNPVAPSNQPQDPEANQDVEPGEVTIDADGKIRDARTGKYVPHQAFHAERVRRQALESEIKARDEKLARAEERLTMMTQIMEGQRQAQQPAQTPTQPEPEVDIDPEKDLFGAFKQLMERNKKLNDELASTKQMTTEQVAQMQMVDRYRQDITRFSGENADFFDAYRHLTNTRRAELKVLGFTDDTVGNQMAAEERALAMKAMKDGRSAAQMMYELAKAKGYAKSTPAPTPTPTPPAPQAQLQPAPQPLPPMPVVQPQPAMPALQTNPAAAQRVQNVQNGMQAAATLTGSGGSPGEGMTVDQLVNMSEADFMNFASSMGLRKLDSLLRA